MVCGGWIKPLHMTLLQHCSSRCSAPSTTSDPLLWISAQDLQELRTLRAEARRLQQELQLAAAREASLAQALGRSRAEVAELGARLASVQDSSRAAKRSAREALSELAEENAKLVAAFVDKRRELKRLQVRPLAAWACKWHVCVSGVCMLPSMYNHAGSHCHACFRFQQALSQHICMHGTSSHVCRQDLKLTAPSVFPCVPYAPHTCS